MPQQVTLDNSFEEWRIKFNQFVIEYEDFYSSITGVAGGIYVNRSGDSMSGKLTIDRTTNNDGLEIKTNAGVDGRIDFRRGTVFTSQLSSKLYGTDINSSQVTTFSINTVEIARFSAAGLLGIGTDNPQRGIHLRGSVGSALPSVRLERTGVRTFTSTVIDSGDFHLSDNTSGTTPITVQGSTGHVGVNTSSPARPLHVTGIIRSASANTTGIGQFESYNESGSSQLLMRTFGSAATGTLFSQSQPNMSMIYSAGADSTGLVVGTLTSTPLHFGTNNGTRMTLNVSGLLGICTTAAQRGLHLAGDESSAIPSVRMERTGVRTYSTEVSNTGEFRIIDNTQGANVFVATGGANSAVTLQTQGTGLLNLRVGGSSRLELYNNQQLFFAPTSTDNTTTLRTQEVARNVTVRFEHGSTAITNILGSAGAAGQLVADSGQYDTVSRTDSRAFRWSVNNGTSSAMVLNSSGNLVLNSNTLRLATARTPASATAAGNQGDICWDSNYIYICIATNTWRRIAHSTW